MFDIFDIRLKDFYNKYDELGNFHNGFLQSINISNYVDITFLNEVTLNIMDSFIQNEIGNIVTMNRWNCFLVWDKTEKKYKIKSDFYNSALDSIYVYLLRSQKLFELTQVDFKSFSATETEQIIYGEKETEKNYDKVLVTIKRGNDTINYGQEQKTNNYGQLETTTDFGAIARTLNYGATQKTNIYGARNETNTTGQQINSSDTVHQKHPYDMNTFLDDTKDTTNNTNGSRQDTRQNASYTDSESNTTHNDSDTTASRTDKETTASRTDTETTASKTDTNTYGDVTNDTASRTDTDTIKTHTDTKTRTKIIILSPDKYLEIQKELLKYNVYDLLLASVKDCFTTKSF